MKEKVPSAKFQVPSQHKHIDFIDCIKNAWEKPIYRSIIVLTIIFIIVRIPAANLMFFLHDERDIIFSGWSLARTGSDLYGNFFPLSFHGISPSNPVVAIWWSAVWSLFFPIQSVLSSRLGFVVFSATLLPLSYALARKFRLAEGLSLIFAIVFCFSPWVLHLTSMGMEITIAAPILIAAIIAQLTNHKKTAVLLYLLTYFNYQGFRLIIPFLTIYIEIWHFHRLKENKYSNLVKRIVTWQLLFVAFIIFSVIIEGSATFGRSHELLFFKSDALAKQVDIKRMDAIGVPASIKNLFHNKLTEFTNQILQNSLKGLDVSNLFFTGDSSPLNGPAYGGLLLLFSLPFFVIGFASLNVSRYKGVKWLAGFVLIGLVPPMFRFDNSTFAIRGFISLIGFAAIIAVGIDNFNEYVKTKGRFIQRVVYVSFVSVIVMNFIHFTYNYLWRRPGYLANSFNEVERHIATRLAKNGKAATYVFDSVPRDYFLSAAYLSGANMSAVQESMKSGRYKLNNVEFLTCESVDSAKYRHTDIYYISSRCYENSRFDALRMSDMVEKINSVEVVKTVLFFTNNKLSTSEIFIRR